MYAEEHEGVRDDQSRGVVAGDCDRVDVLSKLDVCELYLSTEQ